MGVDQAGGDQVAAAVEDHVAVLGRHVLGTTHGHDEPVGQGDVSGPPGAAQDGTPPGAAHRVSSSSSRVRLARAADSHRSRA